MDSSSDKLNDITFSKQLVLLIMNQEYVRFWSGILGGRHFSDVPNDGAYARQVYLPKSQFSKKSQS